MPNEDPLRQAMLGPSKDLSRKCKALLQSIISSTLYAIQVQDMCNCSCFKLATHGRHPDMCFILHVLASYIGTTLY